MKDRGSALRNRLGKDHALAIDLWKTGWYEARLLAALVDHPEPVTHRQMHAWAASFENWVMATPSCFHLFDRIPFARELARHWTGSSREFVKRAGFLLMACLALLTRALPTGTP